MFLQSLWSVTLCGLILVLGVVGWFAATEIDEHERYIAYKSGVALFYIAAVGNPYMDVVYVDRDGQGYNYKAKALYEHPQTKEVWRRVKAGAVKGSIISIPIFVIAVTGVAIAFGRAGKRASNDDHIRGMRVIKAPMKLQAELTKLKPLGTMNYGPVRLPRAYEPSHQLIVGGPGTGKSQIILRQLQAIRKAGERAVLYDPGGIFTEAFFRKGYDVILNPLDDRSPPWNLWDEVREDGDYEHFSNTILPVGKSTQPFWQQAGQILFAATAQKLGEDQENPTNADLLHALTKLDMESLTDFLAGTDAMSVLGDGEAKKMAASIRATLTANLTGFRYLTDDDDRFSIRDFIQDDHDDRWLFITTKADKLAALRHLITLWVDIAVSELLSLRPDDDRRVHFFFDELPSLSELPSLQNAMAQARKYGGSITLGLQSIPQLKDIYGDDRADAITGNCATWCVLRTNDVPTSQWASEAIGDVEKTEANEGLSIAQNSLGDRRTMTRQTVRREVVMPSELRELPNLSGYLVLGRGHPVLRTSFPYDSYDPVALPFVERAPKDKDRPLSARAAANGPESGNGAAGAGNSRVIISTDPADHGARPTSVPDVQVSTGAANHRPEAAAIEEPSGDAAVSELVTKQPTDATELDQKPAALEPVVIREPEGVAKPAEDDPSLQKGRWHVWDETQSDEGSADRTGSEPTSPVRASNTAPRDAGDPVTADV